MANPGLFLLIFVIFKHKLNRKKGRFKPVSNSDRWSRRQALMYRCFHFKSLFTTDPESDKTPAYKLLIKKHFKQADKRWLPIVLARLQLA